MTKYGPVPESSASYWAFTDSSSSAGGSYWIRGGVEVGFVVAVGPQYGSDK
jgi:hypothetical protein